MCVFLPTSSLHRVAYNFFCNSEKKQTFQHSNKCYELFSTVIIRQFCYYRHSCISIFNYIKFVFIEIKWKQFLFKLSVSFNNSHHSYQLTIPQWKQSQLVQSIKIKPKTKKKTKSAYTWQCNKTLYQPKLNRRKSWDTQGSPKTAIRDIYSILNWIHFTNELDRSKLRFVFGKRKKQNKAKANLL